MKKIKNLILLNIAFPCGCCLFPKSKTKRNYFLIIQIRKINITKKWDI